MRMYKILQVLSKVYLLQHLELGVGMAQWPGFESRPGVFVVGSRLAPVGFLRVLRFSSLYKNSNSTSMGDPHVNQPRLMWFHL